MRLRVHLLRAAGLDPQELRAGGGADPDGPGAGARGAGGRGHGDRAPGLRHAGRDRLRRGVRHSLSRGPGQVPLHQPDLHPADPVAARGGRDAEAEPAQALAAGQAGDRGRRLDRPRHLLQAGHRHAAPGESDGGPHAHLLATDALSLLHGRRHRLLEGADRGPPHRPSDPRLHRRRLARLPVHPGADEGGRPGHHRRVLPSLLRWLLPGRGSPAAGDGQAGSRNSVTSEGLSYAAAGVDIAAYERALERVRPLLAATAGPEVAAGVGPFAGLYRLPSGGYLAASADGVGTKIKVAIALGRHRGIGVDLVNHCVNDIATTRARPLFLLDYFATGSLQEEVFGEVVAGLAEACQAAGCALLGGETAEMPGLYALGDYDLAGFIVGLVAEPDVPDPASVRAGDLLLGLPSSGLHTNGFSLVRKVFKEFPPELLEPHRSYLGELGTLRWKTAAHVTGGGIPGNLPRALPPGLGYRLDRSAWQTPQIFREIQERGRVSDEEMLGTFNMGIGMVLVMEPAAVPPGALVIGEVVAG
ncbi:MAG: phosphoribosylformylglycinamidine cyclo-ligase [Chloroflexi bacterium]|nr:MAG: phosphoribosylformylglycinamidine cyclo-ligase [Chloroflexota bacterium]